VGGGQPLQRIGGHAWARHGHASGKGWPAPFGLLAVPLFDCSAVEQLGATLRVSPKCHLGTTVDKPVEKPGLGRPPMCSRPSRAGMAQGPGKPVVVQFEQGS
jgi:hypothetical protein